MCPLITSSALVIYSQLNDIHHQADHMKWVPWHGMSDSSYSAVSETLEERTESATQAYFIAAILSSLGTLYAWIHKKVSSSIRYVCSCLRQIARQPGGPVAVLEEIPPATLAETPSQITSSRQSLSLCEKIEIESIGCHYEQLLVEGPVQPCSDEELLKSCLSESMELFETKLPPVKGSIRPRRVITNNRATNRVHSPSKRILRKRCRPPDPAKIVLPRLLESRHSQYDKDDPYECKLKIDSQDDKFTVLEQNVQSYDPDPDSPPKFNGEQLNCLRVLGEGAFGAVYLVEGMESKTKYAVKTQDVSEQSSLTRTSREVEIMSRFESPFILKLHGTIQKGQSHLLLLEPCEHGDLEDVMCSNILNESTCKFLAANIIIALENLHSMRVLHRDLKPENFLLSDQGYLKLADFGLSIDLSGGKATEIAGTPCYMAPEMIDSNNTGYSFPADYWSLGILLHQMLADRMPIPDNLEVIETLAYIDNNVIEPDLPSCISQTGRDFVCALLQRDPGNRIGSADNPCRKHPWFADIVWKDLETQSEESPLVLNDLMPS